MVLCTTTTTTSSKQQSIYYRVQSNVQYNAIWNDCADSDVDIGNKYQGTQCPTLLIISIEIFQTGLTHLHTHIWVVYLHCVKSIGILISKSVNAISLPFVSVLILRNVRAVLNITLVFFYVFLKYVFKILQLSRCQTKQMSLNALYIIDGPPCKTGSVSPEQFFFFLELNMPVRLFHDFIQRQRCNSSEYIICTLSTQLVHKNCQHIAFEILS